MASGGSSEVLMNFLNAEEYNLIPEDVRAKINTHFEEKFEEFLTSKALFESSRTNHDEKTQTLERQLQECQVDLENTKTSLYNTDAELKVFQTKVEELKNELSTLQESVKHYESENNDLRRQRNEAVDERDTLTRMVERRDMELERLREDIKTLSSELSSAINAKCEALANSEEVESKRIALDFREKSFEQEREFMKKKIASLTADLNETNAELAILRRNHAAADVAFQSQLESKTVELRILMEKDKQLTEANSKLVERIEALGAKLMAQRESEATMADNYQQELQAKAKLADLYKRMMEDANSKSQELTDAIRSLQRLLEDSNKQYSDLKAELEEKELKMNQTLEKKNQCIAALKEELKNANELIKYTKQDTMEKAIEGLSPAAAAASKLIKSGLSLTQIYTQYVGVYEELTLQKEENRKLNLYISTIVQELNEKAPILKKQRENYESAVESIASLCKQNDQLVEESRVLREEAREAKKISGHHELEEARGGVISLDDANSSLDGSFGASDIISKKLVTFRDIEDLQDNNKKLLALVRELSSKHEEMETNQPQMDVSSLQERINSLKAELTSTRENLNQQSAMVDQIVRQRDLYRDMYQKAVKGESDEQVPLQRPGEVRNPSPAKPSQTGIDPSIMALKEKALEDTVKRLSAAEKQLLELRAEYDEYRKERRVNEDMLNDQIDKMMTRVRDLSTDNCKLVTQAEFQTERFKALLANLSSQKAQITALETKNKSYSETIAKHEVSLKSLMQESLSAQAKLSRAEVELENLREECSLLKDSEGRLRREKEARERESTSQTMLLANLESIKMTLERTESEGRLKVEQRLEECNRECTALRRRLQEEQENFKELSRHLERQTAAAVAREEEERKLAHEARQELNIVREELKKKQSDAEILETKLREASRTPPVVVQRNDEQLTTRVRELESKLMASEGEARSLKQQLEDSRKHLQQYTEIAGSAEQQLQEFVKMHEEMKSDLEKKLSDAQKLQDSTNLELTRVQSELSRLKSAGNQTSSDLQLRVQELEVQCKEANNLLHQASESGNALRAELETVRLEMQSAIKAQQESEEKYAHEVTLHSNDIQVMSRLKEELASEKAQNSELKAGRQSAEEALKLGRSMYEDREKLMKSQMKEQQDRLSELEKQNTLLHEQIEALGTQLIVLQAQVGSPSKNTVSSSTTPNSSFAEGEDFHGPEQLLQVVKFLRREKELAVTRMEVISTENSRLKAEHDILEKQAREAREELDRMKQREQCESVTSSRHQELLRKVETLNAITDSNRLLREERDALREKEQEFVNRIRNLEQELEPLKERHNELSIQIERERAENNIMKTELTKWRQRTSQLIERANKNSPEDWKRLQNERETLSKQLTVEKEAHNKTQEDLKLLRLEKSKLDEQLQLLTQRHNALEAEFKRNLESSKKTLEELNNLRARLGTLETELQEHKNNAAKAAEETSKLNADIAARETREQQIRKIAKKYKAQYEDLKKSTDEERSQWEAQRTQHESQAAAAMLTDEVKDQLREEGKREAEQKLREVETSHSERVNELSSQIEAFKNSEERAKTVLKNARNRIVALTEQKSALEKQMSSGRDESEARLNVLKSQYEGRIARLEKEKNDALAERSREIENLNARMNDLQRMLHSRAQGSSKPSTSSGHVDKGASDPPTANIKPMAGPSSSSGKQQTQQSVTVSPWRAGNETPLASIRPMSQSRMAAVQPCTLQPSGNSAVLMMPLHHQQAPSQQQPQTAQQQQPSQPQSQTQQQSQQQAVHTTGNSSGTGSTSSSTPSTSSGASGSGMDAITSSDYMPATSSASPASVGPIRQVAVPPTQQATVGPSTSRTEEASAESTQVVGQAHPQAAQQQVVGQAQAAQPQQAQGSQQPPQPQQQQQQSQQAVAMVLPRERVEQQQQTQQPPQPAQAHPPSQQQATTTPQQQAQPPQQQVPPASASAAGPSQQPQVGPLATPGSQHEQSVIVASSQQASSSNTVTTSQSGLKRPRDREADGDSSTSRAGHGEGMKLGWGQPVGTRFQAPAESSECGSMDVEYQVPTSSQRDQEDDIIVVTSEEEDDEDEGPEDDEDEEPDDGPEFQADEDDENEEGYEIETYDREDRDLVIGNYDDVEGPDIDDDNGGEQDNEVEIIEQDSNEVPNQPGSSSSSSGGPGDATQHQGYEDGGDDCIVPSTPTLFVPRRTDGFGEAVSSPQVPSAGRFTFSDANPPAVRAVPCTPTLFGTRRAEGYSDAYRAMSVRHFTFSEAPTPPSHTGVAQVVCEGMDDTRVDLSQLEDPSTGRSVPTTPLQVSPQGELAASELANEVGQSSGVNVEASGSLAGPSSVPSISVSLAEHQQVESDAPSQQEMLDLELETDQREAEGDGGELIGGQADEPEEVMVLDLEEESADGVSSEGSKPPQPSQSQQALDLEMEEGREAEASEPAASSPQGSPHGSQGSPHGRGSGTARRSQGRPGNYRRGRGNQRPTPIVWNEPGSTSPRSMGDGPPRGRGMPMMPMGRGLPIDPRGFPPRGQRARRMRKGYGNPFGGMPY
ncbi:Nucleoprotein TPR [Frankliniella fusca]|uniref:Nucleoprotein TPR n=1 Tax=Frankliniella fusca TaxID=407009 RepID=A0AAE1H5D6_9NEOP|nr:Nucleoprotein TPR [Frankliniella fusca]